MVLHYVWMNRCKSSKHGTILPNVIEALSGLQQCTLHLESPIHKEWSAWGGGDRSTIFFTVAHTISRHCVEHSSLLAAVNFTGRIFCKALVASNPKSTCREVFRLPLRVTSTPSNVVVDDVSCRKPKNPFLGKEF